MQLERKKRKKKQKLQLKTIIVYVHVCMMYAFFCIIQKLGK